MPDLAKVIRGLECCILRDPDDHARCSQCSYGSNCVNRLKMDALKLLKAQEPRVMTLEEVLNRFMTGQPWYCEVNRNLSRAGDGWELPVRARNTEIESLRSDQLRENTYSVYSDARNYGRVWRCWTSRPTDDQRKAAKWE